MADMPFSKENKNVHWIPWFCVVGVLVNLGGSIVTARLGMPIYLDTVGTVFVSMISGYVPGIAVGLLTNLFKFTVDTSAVYYASLNVLIAFTSTYFARNKVLRSPKAAIELVGILALIGGGLGGILTWMLFQANSPEISAGLAEKIYSIGVQSRFLAELVASLALDLWDKVITVAVALLVFLKLPEKIKRRVRFDGWQQRPLTMNERVAAKKSPTERISIRTKILLLLVVASAAIGLSAVGIGFALYRNATIRDKMEYGQSAAKMFSVLVEPKNVDDYLTYGAKAEGFSEMISRMETARDGSPGIRYVYGMRFKKDGCHIVFDLDAGADDLGFAPSEVIEYDEVLRKMMPDLLAGRPVTPVITHDEYGSLLTAFEPVYDRRGHCVCYVGVDIPVEEMQRNAMVFFAKLVSLFFGVFVLVVGIGLWLAEYNLILPVNTMAIASNAFAYDSFEQRDESLERLKRLEIRTGDEIQNLYRALVKTTEDSSEYMDELSNKNAAIEKMQNGLILVLADMVESRDLNTGQHVRKTAEYVSIIMTHMAEAGVYGERMTDEFMLDVYRSAPLHDIGKINIPDAILNKPGRLTDEEFDTMKSHTTAGRDIISEVIEIVPEPGYLTEARDIAAHHHERWDGKGYPDGLAGEEIPLSARIMAVADVFDALVSKRSYKPGFPFEKAIAIIEEGRGTQFDPQVVDAFLEVKDAIREVAESFGELK